MSNLVHTAASRWRQGDGLLMKSVCPEEYAQVAQQSSRAVLGMGAEMGQWTLETL